MGRKNLKVFGLQGHYFSNDQGSLRVKFNARLVHTGKFSSRHKTITQFAKGALQNRFLENKLSTIVK